MNQIPQWVIKSIPALKHSIYLPQRFKDSTHKLWQLALEDTAIEPKKAFLKVCENTNTPFWLIMQQLFGLDLYKQIAHFDRHYQIISSMSALSVPDLIKAKSFPDLKTGENRAYILSSKIEGFAVESINSDMVDQLARYLVELHQNKSKTWGLIGNAGIDSMQWNKILQQVLTDYSASNLIPDHYLSKAKAEIEVLSCSAFIPMIPDLRWDQFLQQGQELVALVDLDAFVLAPRELDFVILEYMLTADQQRQFVEVYSQYYAIPELSEVRTSYRLLLFFMQIYGESDIDKWMTAEGQF
ncbi:MAG: hypothetical protein V3U71_12770 [Cocleimonas sp.]